MVSEQNQIFMNKNRDYWDERVPIHARTSSYGLEQFLAGTNKLNPLEIREVGDVQGKNLLHLQCHFGLDTLSWARLGAHVTGVDFSQPAIELAQDLAQRSNLNARFLCCNLYSLPNHLMGQYDIVFTSYGVLNWLPDISRWAQIVASYVKPGGFFYIADFHPFAMVFDDDINHLEYRYPYFGNQAIQFESRGSYADRNVETRINDEFSWNHTLSEIISGLIENGLRIEFLHEFPFSVFQQFPILEMDENGMWVFPNGQHPIPLMFSLRAVKT